MNTANAVADRLGQSFDMFRVLVGRELHTRYKGSFFGILWAVLSPLGTVVVMSFVFGRVLDMRIPNYTAFIYTGLLPWIWFSTAVQSGASTLAENRDLVRIPFFYRPLLPAIVTSTNFLLYLFALPVLLVLVVIDGLPITTAMLALPAVWIVQSLLTLAVTILVSATAVLVRDIQHLLGVVLLFWFYLTPVFYDLQQVPLSFRPWFELNPMAALVLAHREILVHGRSPDWNALGYWAVIGAVLLTASIFVFRALEDAFVEES